MTITDSQTPAALRDVFYEFALAHPHPDAAALDAFTRRYPQHAPDLTEFAIELAIDAMLDRQAGDWSAAEDDDNSPDVDFAMSRFQNRLYDMRRAAPPAAPAATAAAAAIDNPFLRLDRVQTRALASRLHANTAFVMMLRDREIDPETMTEGFHRALEEEMHVPMDVLCAHFAAQPQVQGHVRFASEVKPAAARKLSFEEAVRSANLSPEQQAHLLSL
jgi:hypothetical protein